MEQFFKNKVDLANWVMNQKNSNNAAQKLIIAMTHAGLSEDEKTVIKETCSSIKQNLAMNTSLDVLSSIIEKGGLAKFSSSNLQKTAQVVRNPGLFNEFKVRICPKIPKSFENGIVSTYVCANHCLDGTILAEDPTDVICNETLWRRHIADKFSREFRDEKGNLVGGYIRGRFVSLADNADTYESMNLANGERTKMPKPHHYSMEARLSEGRGEEVKFVKANINGKKISLGSKDNSIEENDLAREFITKLSSGKKEILKYATHNYEPKYENAYSEIIDLIEKKVDDSSIYAQISQKYDISITAAAKLKKMASTKMEQHNGTIYSFDNIKKKI